MDCFVCGGKGCGLCKQSGWLEIMGAGMVHPMVLRNGGYDPARTAASRSAWGRSASPCSSYGIDDIRHFWANDLRFLRSSRSATASTLPRLRRT